MDQLAEDGPAHAGRVLEVEEVMVGIIGVVQLAKLGRKVLMMCAVVFHTSA